MLRNKHQVLLRITFDLPFLQSCLPGQGPLINSCLAPKGLGWVRGALVGSKEPWLVGSQGPCLAPSGASVQGHIIGACLKISKTFFGSVLSLTALALLSLPQNIVLDLCWC